MNRNIETDLKRAMKLISADWGVQNNRNDRATNFIYDAATLEECLAKIDEKNVSREYALHRWYNYMTSIRCEDIFCEFGAVREENRRNHDVDIYIGTEPFDVKLTVYPAKLSNRPYDLSTREGKNDMIRWFYKNQSQQNRKQLLNRLYVVCDVQSSYDNMVMKSDFELMRRCISEFMDNAGRYGINEIEISENSQIYRLKSDIIHLSK